MNDSKQESDSMEEDIIKRSEPSRTEVRGQSVVLDEGIFRYMDFIECNMIYRGGSVPLLMDNRFVNCKFTLEKEARNTADFLHAIGSGEGNEGGRDLALSLLGLLKSGE